MIWIKLSLSAMLGCHSRYFLASEMSGGFCLVSSAGTGRKRISDLGIGQLKNLRRKFEHFELTRVANTDWARKSNRSLP
jgi:hypothetical protein